MIDCKILKKNWQKNIYYKSMAIDLSYFKNLTSENLHILSKEKNVQKRTVKKTLLIQHCELHFPELLNLQEQFSFIPHWRFDDVMVSLSSNGGGVGKHVDYYDVFLIQAKGVKKWSIFLPDGKIKTFISRPGDLLYLPPGIYHHGVSKSNNCVTISIGFRGPSMMEMISSLLEHHQNILSYENNRYKDPESFKTTSPFSLNNSAIKSLQNSFVNQFFKSKESTALWFGPLMTSPKRRALKWGNKIFNYQNIILTREQKNKLKTFLRLYPLIKWNHKYKKIIFIGESIYFFIDGSTHIIPLNSVTKKLVTHIDTLNLKPLKSLTNECLFINGVIYRFIKLGILIKELPPHH